ncbi:alpha-N-arabinofuranosidase [Asticcacaulis tiandongensis]|uniref:alpha-N-arabinofuranosidase n=1 Tax=Asticcacaulis tiandongensis TaxID=2565365 RepID=UPI0015E875C2|nr:alpha-L-arabinofuranosidase C-terminal domain-containing protein [Asticcacaulis tiandongensis]
MRQLVIGLMTAIVLATSPYIASAQTSATLDTSAEGPTISRHLHGQFVEHLGRGVYEGIWVGEDSSIPNVRGIRSDVVSALKHIRVPLIRWPGGCFADDYHWRDGIGPRDQRKGTINSSWSRQPESNQFGTHEFFDLVEQVGAEAYISLNMGSGSVRDSQAWLQYMTAPASTGPGSERAKNGRTEPWSVPFVGVGNETWGCGGNMTPEYYSDLLRHYSAYLKNASGPTRPYLIAVGPDTDDYNWTKVVMERAAEWRSQSEGNLLWTSERPLFNGIALHFYTLPTSNWGTKGAQLNFPEDQWMSTMQRALLTEEVIVKNLEVMDKADPKKRVDLIVDEWGTWYDSDPTIPAHLNTGLYQQNTLRDALVAAVSLNIFQNHADRVKVANIAQMVNVLQSMILTDGPKMVLTPTYHVFDLYKVHQDATLIPLTFTASAYSHNGASVPALHATASRDTSGKIHVSIANLDPHKSHTLTLKLEGHKGKTVTGRILTAPEMDSHNSFEKPDVVRLQPFTTAKLTNTTLTLTAPAKSVITLELP